MNRAGAVTLFAAVLSVLASACAPLVKPAGPPAVEPVVNAGTIVADDGASLPLHAWPPEGAEPSAVILGVHGFNDYGRFLDAPATWLAARGIATYAYDQRGFGRAANRGLWPGTETLARDLKAAVRALRRRHPGVPLYVLGESMGGAVVMVAMAEPDPPDVDGVILVAPAVWGRETMPWYQTAALWTAAHTVPWKTATGRGLGIRPSDNMEMLRAFSRDPLVIKKTRFELDPRPGRSHGRRPGRGPPRPRPAADPLRRARRTDPGRVRRAVAIPPSRGRPDPAPDRPLPRRLPHAAPRPASGHRLGGPGRVARRCPRAASIGS